MRLGDPHPPVGAPLLSLCLLSLCSSAHGWMTGTSKMMSSSPTRTRPACAMSAPSPSLLDAQLGIGYEGKGEDWSFAKSSERKDRPLTNEQLKVLTAKSNAAGLGPPRPPALPGSANAKTRPAENGVSETHDAQLVPLAAFTGLHLNCRFLPHTDGALYVLCLCRCS